MPEKSDGPGIVFAISEAIFLQTARKPNSVLDDHSSRRRITTTLQQPTRRFRLAFRHLFAWAYRADTPPPPEEKRRSPCLFGLAPCGVYHAASVTRHAVRSYRTFSPLPRLHEAVCFLLHWPSRWLEPSVPDVIRHTALRSSDFPLPPLRAAAIIRPPAAFSVARVGFRLGQKRTEHAMHHARSKRGKLGTGR